MSFYAEGNIVAVENKKKIAVRLDIDSPDTASRFRLAEPFDSVEEARESLPAGQRIAVSYEGDLRTEYYWPVVSVERIELGAEWVA